MSDDDEDQIDSDANLFDASMEGVDNMGFGPLVPTESERSLMERVRQELKHELKQVTDCTFSCARELSLTFLLSLDMKYNYGPLSGLQGKDCRYKGGNIAQEKGWQTPW